MDETLRNKYLPIALIAVGVSSCVWLLYQYHLFFHDDAYIELRYVRNLLEKAEIAWNPGERVQGFTSPLHLFLTAFVGKLGFALPAAARIVNFTSCAFLLLAFRSGLNRVTRSPLTRAIGWFLLLTSPPLICWAWGGLEGPLVAVLVCWGFAALMPLLQGRENGMRSAALVSGVAFALATLTRFDAAIYLFGACTGWLALCFNRNKIDWLSGLALIGPAFLAIGIYILWSMYYFGDSLPNTYYAKIGIPLSWRWHTGVLYVAKSFVIEPIFPLVGVLCLLRAGVFKSPVWAALLTSAVCITLYTLWAGGDHMPSARFFVPLIAPMILLFAFLTADHSGSLIRPYALPAALLCGGLAIAFTFVGSIGGIKKMDSAAFVGTLVGKYIEREWPEGSLVALHTAGSTPYFAGHLRFVDMLGLNDRVIAKHPVTSSAPGGVIPMPGHAKGDGKYVLSRNPDFIILGGAEGHSIDEPFFRSDFELAANPDFTACYTLQKAYIDYDDETAKLGFPRPRPLEFSYYKRTCSIKRME